MEDKPIKLIYGVVKYWNEQRGYGFVTPDDGGPDLFCHARALERCEIFEPQPGDRLFFERVPSRRRPDSQEVGGVCERLNQDGSRRVEPPRPAPRPARPETLEQVAKREAAAFASMHFVAKAPR